MIYRPSDTCECGHSMMVHIITCWAKVGLKTCPCKEFKCVEQTNNKEVTDA